VVAVTAATNSEALADIARRTGAVLAVVSDEARLPDLAERLAGSGCRAAAGAGALIEAAAGEAELVIAAIVGCAGLRPVMAAVEAGRTVALANKEALVTAGALMTEAATRSGATLLPVDSEHNAIFQCLACGRKEDVAKIVLTASGGPFRTASAAAMRDATPAEAVAHPNWSMGAKISVDSASMMNKALEMIEAAYLFSMPPEQIDVLVHPQSIVHSLVEYADGSTMAQLGPPDMRAPIAYALAWPGRITWPAPRLDLAAIGSLTFEHPDLQRFPAIRLAREALKIGGGAPAAMNAANEVAVAAFLGRRIGFLDIAATVERVLEALEGAGDLKPCSGDVIESAFAIDALSRRTASELLDRSQRLN